MTGVMLYDVLQPGLQLVREPVSYGMAPRMTGEDYPQDFTLSWPNQSTPPVSHGGGRRYVLWFTGEMSE